MCRILFVKSKVEFNISEYIEPFAGMCKNSREFQGHGWGFASNGLAGWYRYKNINPIWNDKSYPEQKTNLLIAHARSAFEDKDIRVENNMPFFDEKFVFVFNGELRNVKIKSDGRIGAEKIFNFIKKFYKGNMAEAIKKAVSIIKKRTGYLRAVNIVISDVLETFAYSTFSEDAEYFTLRYSINKKHTILCSEELNINSNWQRFSTNKVQVFE